MVKKIISWTNFDGEKDDFEDYIETAGSNRDGKKKLARMERKFWGNKYKF